MANDNSNTMNDLGVFLNEHTIPHSHQHTGFLEIIKKQYHENINSSIYAHFLNAPLREVRSLFLNALIELISEKCEKQLTMQDAFTQTEVTTSSGRLDILIDGHGGTGKILIENKLYHWLHNDLLEYWNYFSFPEDKKVGILLTLEKHEIPEEVKFKFINITHLEWITKVKGNFLEEKLPVNYQVYIGDFIKTIENLSKSYTMNESAKFYFAHTEKVLSASATVAEAHNFINNQLEYIANEIGWKTYGNSLSWRNFWDEVNHIDTYLTILTNDLLNGQKQFTLILELNRNDKEKTSEVRDYLVKINHKQYRPNNGGFSKGSYIHFQTKTYPILESELENFGKIVVQKIKEDFADMTLKVIEYLYPEKIKNFIWKDQFLKVE